MHRGLVDRLGWPPPHVHFLPARLTLGPSPPLARVGTSLLAPLSGARPRRVCVWWVGGRSGASPIYFGDLFFSSFFPLSLF